MTKEALLLEAVSYRYAESEPDSGMLFDLSVRAGEWLAVIGPSGSGKSTLLDLAAGFLVPKGGSIFIADSDVTFFGPSGRPLSFLFQENNLFAHLSAFQNVALGVSPTLRLKDPQKQKVANALASVGLSGLERRRPGQMSGGERQRVALARAFVRGYPLLLLDEPFSALGPALRQEMMWLLQRLKKASSMPTTIVIVTHHPEDARGFADRIAFVNNGRVAAIGPTEQILADSRNTDIKSYLGRGYEASSAAIDEERKRLHAKIPNEL